MAEALCDHSIVESEKPGPRLDFILTPGTLGSGLGGNSQGSTHGVRCEGHTLINLPRKLLVGPVKGPPGVPEPHEKKDPHGDSQGPSDRGPESSRGLGEGWSEFSGFSPHGVLLLPLPLGIIWLGERFRHGLSFSLGGRTKYNVYRTLGEGDWAFTYVSSYPFSLFLPKEGRGFCPRVFLVGNIDPPPRNRATHSRPGVYFSVPLRVEDTVV